MPRWFNHPVRQECINSVGSSKAKVVMRNLTRQEWWKRRQFQFLQWPRHLMRLRKSLEDTRQQWNCLEQQTNCAKCFLFQNHLLSPWVHGFYLNTITWICMITRNRINNNNNNDNNSCNNISMKSCNKVNKHSIISSRKTFELPWVVKPSSWGAYLEIRKSLAST